MGLILKAGGDFTPAPEGTWPGVCVDVVDLGIVKSAMFKPRHMCQLRWVLDAEPPLPTGKPHMVVRGFGATLHENSSLRPFLESWRGKRFTEEELGGFDPENLIGVPCLIQVLHNSKNGKTYANIASIMPLPRGMRKLEIPADYIRQSIRDERAQLESQPDGPNDYEPSTQISDEDVLF